MFTLPSAWNLIVSTVVFFIAAGYFHRYLNSQGLPRGMTRSMVVFTLASLMSWGSGELVDWSQEKIEGPQPAAQTPDDLSQLLKTVSRMQSQPRN
ncbi:hypothetical protein V3O24_01525 [Methylobacter sp. Wu8]|uniref:Uncharacterized protein n=1 Tax=Methylobacter tundripaludum TaxID=173365 RepID=A0A2S6H3K3_9GAMM|nr:hypothetical protein [Methylobacter tundripaludum]PPK72011.1 hypothetical protein B0F88_105123 [Methylobacter tundripaludum]